DRSSLGPLDDAARALARRAGEHLASAGKRAGTRGDATGAVGLLKRALALMPEDWEGRTDAMIRLGDQLYEAGELERSLEVMQSAEERGRESGDIRTEWLMKVVRATVEFAHLPARTVTDLRTLSQEAIQVFEELGDKQGLANAWNL